MVVGKNKTYSPNGGFCWWKISHGRILQKYHQLNKQQFNNSTFSEGEKHGKTLKFPFKPKPWMSGPWNSGPRNRDVCRSTETIDVLPSLKLTAPHWNSMVGRWFRILFFGTRPQSLFGGALLLVVSGEGMYISQNQSPDSGTLPSITC